MQTLDNDTTAKMTGETPEVLSDKRKPREDRQNHRYHRYNGYHTGSFRKNVKSKIIVEIIIFTKN